jgi:predicted XRE-type DNA-binding protein
MNTARLAKTKASPSRSTAVSPTTDKLLIEKSSGNIFADLGFSAAESANLSLRSECMMALEEWFRSSGLTQVSAAKQLGVTQPRFNAMLKGAINQFSLDALVNMAALAGLAVKLSLKRRGVSAANASRLAIAMAQDKAGKAKPRKLVVA